MRTISVTLLALLAVIGLSLGCDNKGKGSDGDTTKTDSVILDPAPECADLKAKQFCWQGLDFIMIGDSLTWKNYPAPEGGVFKDTVFSDTLFMESGNEITDWNVRMLSFASGKIFLEADFDTGHLLNRMRIETPEYSLKNGLRVGSTAAEVFGAYKNETLRVTPFDEFGVMEVIRTLLVGNQGRSITFHFALGPWYQIGQPTYSPESIPADAKVTRIVVM